MSQLQASLICLPLPDHQFAGRRAFRHLHDHQRIRPDHDGRGHVADRHLRPVDRREALAADVQFAAGDRRFGLNLGNLRSAVANLCRSCHRY